MLCGDDDVGEYSRGGGVLESLTFWWSIVSTVIGVLLLCVTISQVIIARYERKRSSSQVKIWMQDANGIVIAMQRIVSDNLEHRYSTTNDMANTVFSLQATASALFQSLYEERCVTEEEYKMQQKKYKEDIERIRQTAVSDKVASPDPVVAETTPKAIKHIGQRAKKVRRG